ncbi:MAG: preprotein translocase subunit YajC [Verrucomicrobiota bacterium]|jgi:preprotein translocase subunit YajC
MLLTLLAQAAASPPAGPLGGGGTNLVVWMIAMIVIMFFVVVRPQRKRQQEQQRLVSSLKTGDRVVTNAGIHGLISNVKDTTVIVKVADNVKIEMEKSAIGSVLKSNES